MSVGSGILEAIEVGSCWFDRWRSALTDMEMSLPKCQRVDLEEEKEKEEKEVQMQSYEEGFPTLVKRKKVSMMVEC